MGARTQISELAETVSDERSGALRGRGVTRKRPLAVTLTFGPEQHRRKRYARANSSFGVLALGGGCGVRQHDGQSDAERELGAGHLRTIERGVGIVCGADDHEWASDQRSDERHVPHERLDPVE